VFFFTGSFEASSKLVFLWFWWPLGQHRPRRLQTRPFPPARLASSLPRPVLGEMALFFASNTGSRPCARGTISFFSLVFSIEFWKRFGEVCFPFLPVGAGRVLYSPLFLIHFNLFARRHFLRLRSRKMPFSFFACRSVVPIRRPVSLSPQTRWAASQGVLGSLVCCNIHFLLLLLITSADSPDRIPF